MLSIYCGESSVTKIIRNGHQGKLKRSQQLNDHNFALIPPWHWQQWCWICFCQQCVLWGHCWFCDWPNINENLLKLCFTKNSCKGRTVLFGLLIKDRFLLLVQYWQESASSTSVFLKSFQLLYLKALNPYYLVSKTCQTEDRQLNSGAQSLFCVLPLFWSSSMMIHHLKTHCEEKSQWRKGNEANEVWWSSFENTLWRKIIIRKNIVKKIHKLKTHCEEKSQWRKAKEVWWSSRNSIKGFRYSQTSILAQDRKQLETRQGSYYEDNFWNG